MRATNRRDDEKLWDVRWPTCRAAAWCGGPRPAPPESLSAADEKEAAAHRDVRRALARCLYSKVWNRA